MTDTDIELLQASVDQVVVLETIARDVLAQVLFVFAEGETPDCFYLEMERGADGRLVSRESGGHSILLADIVAVRPVPE